MKEEARSYATLGWAILGEQSGQFLGGKNKSFGPYPKAAVKTAYARISDE